MQKSGGIKGSLEWKKEENLPFKIGVSWEHAWEEHLYHLPLILIMR